MQGQGAHCAVDSLHEPATQHHHCMCRLLALRERWPTAAILAWVWVLRGRQGGERASSKIPHMYDGRMNV
jgi:hypothetical protein